MPFGLSNAPATFNRMMDIIFREHRAFVGKFFDDMLVFSKKEEEHRKHSAIVFAKIKRQKLYINPKKSELCMHEIHFLGHIVSKDGVQMDPTKVEAIKSWAKPKNLHEVHSFLDLCSYYRRFMRRFAKIVAPMHALQKKGK